MKLNAANFLELSLALAFALMVMSTSIHLTQEATERINQSYEFQTNQLITYNFLKKTTSFGTWPWNLNSLSNNEVDMLLTENQTISIENMSYLDNIWDTNSQSTVSKINIPITSTRSHTIFIAEFPSKKQLIGKLQILKKALQLYKTKFFNYPPNNQLNYLVQNNILTELPNNPFTEASSSPIISPNILDWHYHQTDTTIQLYAYTHPNISLTFNK